MFAPERWAAAFINVVGEALDEGLAALKALIPGIQNIPGVLSGNVSADQLERMIRGSMEKTGASGRGTEYACRLIVLLVKKRQFSQRSSTALLQEIEKMRDRKNGVLLVRVDSAFPLDEEFQKTLQETMKHKLGAKEIKLIPRIVPELLGGYRLQIGSESVDASLRLLLQKMAAHLQRVPLGTSAAGGVAW